MVEPAEPLVATSDVAPAPQSGHAWSRQLLSARSWSTLLLVVASLPMLLFFLVPLLALVLHIAPADVLSTAVDRQVEQAIQVSVVTTSVALILTLVAGAPLAYLLARRPFPGHALLDTLLDLPLVLPPAVAGIALLLAFGRFGLISTATGIPLNLAFTQAAVVLAQTFVAAPLYIKTAIAAFASVDRDLEQAAAVDGAGAWAVFRSITIPLCAPALLGGAVMSWARSLGEFGATILFAGNFPGLTQTMPLAIYLGFESDLRVALTLSLLLLAVSFVVLFLIKVGLRQRLMGATGDAWTSRAKRVHGHDTWNKWD